VSYFVVHINIKFHQYYIVFVSSDDDNDVYSAYVGFPAWFKCHLFADED